MTGEVESEFDLLRFDNPETEFCLLVLEMRSFPQDTKNKIDKK